MCKDTIEQAQRRFNCGCQPARGRNVSAALRILEAFAYIFCRRNVLIAPDGHRRKAKPISEGGLSQDGEYRTDYRLPYLK